MAKVSSNYEVLYILNPTLGEEDTAALVLALALLGVVLAALAACVPSARRIGEVCDGSGEARILLR